MKHATRAQAQVCHTKHTTRAQAQVEGAGASSRGVLMQDVQGSIRGRVVTIPTCCIVRDHSIRKGDYLLLDGGLRPTVIAIDARSRRDARCQHCQIGIKISIEPKGLIQSQFK